MKKFVTFSYGFLCLSGCLYQIKSVTDAYFSYLMTTKVKIELPSELRPPALNICFRYSDVFNKTRFLEESDNYKEDKRVLEEPLGNFVTIEDIFKYTPENNKGLFARCIYRTGGSYNFHEEDGEKCHSFFNVTNFYMQEYICYRIILSLNFTLPYIYTVPAFALTYPNLLYSVSFFKETFGPTEYLKVILNDITGYPFRSASFAPVIKRFNENETNDARYNYFTASYFTVKNILLPAPFATNCVNYNEKGIFDKEDCIKQCLIQLCTDKLDRYPYSILEQNKANYKIIGEHDLEFNLTVKKLYYRFERKCNNLCKSIDCNVGYTVTSVNKDPQVRFMSFNVLIPQFPYYQVEYSPKTKFIEYFIYVFSCFGIWFGLSFLSLNPFRIDWSKVIGKIKSNSSWLQQGEVELGPRSRKVDFMTRSQEYHENLCVYCMQTKFILMNEMKDKLDYLGNLRKI